MHAKSMLKSCLKNRKLTVILQIFQLAMYLLRGQSVSLISEQDLAYAVLHSVFAHSVKWHEESQMFQMKMEGFDDFFLFRVCFWYRKKKKNDVKKNQNKRL